MRKRSNLTNCRRTCRQIDSGNLIQKGNLVWNIFIFLFAIFVYFRVCYIEIFSPSCRCLIHVVKALVKNNYDYMKKVSARVAEVRFQPGVGKPRSRLTGLKISHIIVFSLGRNIISICSLLDFHPELKLFMLTTFSAQDEIFHAIAINFQPGYVG